MDKPQEIDMKLMVFGGLFIVMLLVVSIVFFFIVYQKRLLAEQLKLQQAQHEYQRQLLLSSIDAQEQERARIGRDLHDGVGSSLSTVKLLINQISWHNEESRRIVGSTQDMLHNAIQEVRNISLNLHPSILSRFGLADAVHNLADVLSEASSMEICCEAEEIAGLSMNQELALYRIIQEMMNNAAKHAGAQHLTVRLRQTPAAVEVEVTDDGSGFDYATVSEGSAGIGLKSIEARRSMLEASIRIDSQPGAGTRISLAIPISAPV